MATRFREIFAAASDPLEEKLDLWLGIRLVQQFLNIDGVKHIVRLREKLRNDGYELPRVHIRDKLALEGDAYEIVFDSTVLASGTSKTFDEVLEDLAEIAHTHGVLFECIQD
jgi:flagellar biosynthesis component FlhA